MKNQFLRGIPKDKKAEFLSKLQSGNFSLLKPYQPGPELNFDLQPDGLFLCKETGKIMSEDEISALPGYRMAIHLVGTREQVAHEKPPDNIILMPFSQTEYLESLLKNKSDIVLTYDPTDPVRPFRCKDDQYSFSELMTMNSENPEVVLIMDQATKAEYLKCLEKWC